MVPHGPIRDCTWGKIKNQVEGELLEAYKRCHLLFHFFSECQCLRPRGVCTINFTFLFVKKMPKCTKRMWSLLFAPLPAQYSGAQCYGRVLLGNLVYG